MNHNREQSHLQIREQGFALVITIPIMTLLALLAVGLLLLSTVALQASSKGLLIQQARNNARLSVHLAIGELQLAAGDDPRITVDAVKGFAWGSISMIKAGKQKTQKRWHSF